MSLESKAKELAEKAKVAAGNAADKAKVLAGDVSQKVKEIDVEKMKDDVTGDDGKVSVEAIKALSNKTKAMIGGGLLLIIVMLFSGGGHSYSISNFSEPYPTDGTINERCAKSVFLLYDYMNLLNDGADSDEMIAAMDVAINAVDKSTIKDMPKMEQDYYKTLYELKGTTARRKGQPVGKIKAKRLAIDKYEKAIEKCVAMNGEGK